MLEQYSYQFYVIIIAYINACGKIFPETMGRYMVISQISTHQLQMILYGTLRYIKQFGGRTDVVFQRIILHIAVYLNGYGKFTLLSGFLFHNVQPVPVPIMDDR